MMNDENIHTISVSTAICLVVLIVGYTLVGGCEVINKHTENYKTLEIEQMKACLSAGGQWVIPQHIYRYMCIVNRVNDGMGQDHVEIPKTQ
jgi:hypothetical protein